MNFSRDHLKKIKSIRTICGLLLIVLLIYQAQILKQPPPREGRWLFFYDYPLDYIITLILLFAVLITQITSIFLQFFIQRKEGTPLTKAIIDSIMMIFDFIKFWIFLILLWLLFSAFYGKAGPGAWSEDREIASAIFSLRSIIFLIYDENGNFDKVNCSHELMRETCDRIDMFYRANKKNIPMFSIRKYRESYEKDGKEPIIVHAPFPNSQEVCIYSPLNREGYWVCIDDKLHAVKTRINPANPGYCVEGQSATCPPGGD